MEDLGRARTQPHSQLGPSPLASNPSPALRFLHGVRVPELPAASLWESAQGLQVCFRGAGRPPAIQEGPRRSIWRAGVGVEGEQGAGSAGLWSRNRRPAAAPEPRRTHWNESAIRDGPGGSCLAPRPTSASPASPGVCHPEVHRGLLASALAGDTLSPEALSLRLPGSSRTGPFGSWGPSCAKAQPKSCSAVSAN